MFGQVHLGSLSIHGRGKAGKKNDVSYKKITNNEELILLFQRSF